MAGEFRIFDPARGHFDPVLRDPQVRHQNKTRQDMMPVKKRQRYLDWVKRLENAKRV